MIAHTRYVVESRYGNSDYFHFSFLQRMKYTRPRAQAHALPITVSPIAAQIMSYSKNDNYYQGSHFIVLKSTGMCTIL